MRNAFATVPVAIPFTPYAKAIKSRDKVVAMIDEEIAKHQQAQPGEYDDTMSRMLAAAEDHQVPVDKLRGDLLHVFFASQGGYFVPLTLITLALGQHLDLQEKAREEVMAVAPDGPVTMEQIDRLHVPRPALQGAPPLLRHELRELLRQGQGGDRDRRLPHPQGLGRRGRDPHHHAEPEGVRRPGHLRPRALLARARGCARARQLRAARRRSARPPPLPGRGHRDGGREALPGAAAAPALVHPPRAGLDPEQRALPAAGLGPAAPTSRPRT